MRHLQARSTKLQARFDQCIEEQGTITVIEEILIRILHIADVLSTKRPVQIIFGLAFIALLVWANINYPS